MVRIVSCYRMKQDTDMGMTSPRTGLKKKKGWLLRLQEYCAGKRPCELPVEWEEDEDARIGFVGIPEGWVAREELLLDYLEGVLMELSADYLYLEPSLQKKLCMSESGRVLFAQMGLPSYGEYLRNCWESWLREHQVRASRLAVCVTAENFTQIRDLILPLAEGRNELVLLLTGNEESVAVTEQIADLAEDLGYEYGLVLRHDLTVGQYLEREREIEPKELLVVDLQQEPRLLMGLSELSAGGRIFYLDGMPGPEKEKYGTRRSKGGFHYQSIGEKWRRSAPRPIDSTTKSSYNTMNENMIVKWAKYRKILDRKGNYYGRKEKHTDL